MSAPASEEAHRQLQELVEERFEEGGGGAEPAADGASGGERRLALAAGSAVHRVLEELDLTAGEGGLASELARRRERLPDLLRPLVGEAGIEAAVERTGELLERLAAPPGGSDLLERLTALGGRVVARELPVLLPPDATRGEPDDGPVGFVSGAVDLVYRDPETDELVVADYKTDRVESVEEIAERARVYAPQARLYARAVQESLGLAEPPRAELWFLWPGSVKEV